MGICEANSTPTKPTKEERLKEANDKYNKQKAEKNPNQHSKNDLPVMNKFVDYPTWDGERYKGEGIKRMKGYICELKNDELVRLRDDFWKFLDKMDPQNKKNLKVIRQCTLMEQGILTSNIIFRESSKLFTK
jgi:hypothetical protein